MANSLAARVTGFVLTTDTRSGSKAQADGSFRDWAIHTARVLVGGTDICDVTFQNPADLPGKGEAVDLFVTIRQSGTFLNIDAAGPWTERHTAASVA